MRFFFPKISKRCAVHATNNLLQSQKYTSSEFDKICQELKQQGLDASSWFNPHKSIIPGVGNYDINVVMFVLQKEGYECHWFDSRKDLNSEISNLKDSLFGVLVNREDYALFGMLWETKHWYVIRKIGNEQQWFEFDSKEEGPKKIGTDLNSHLQILLSSDKKHHLIFVTKKQ